MNAIISIENMALRTQNGYFNSRIRKFFNCWNSVYSTNTMNKLRLSHTSLRGAPNINNSLRVGSLVAGNKYQIQELKCVVQYVQRVLYSSSTSALEEEKTHLLTGPLTKLQAQDLIMRLTGEERMALLTALQEFQSEKRKAEYEGNHLLCKRDLILFKYSYFLISY
jgi:hypothetical protein